MTTTAVGGRYEPCLSAEGIDLAVRAAACSASTYDNRRPCRDAEGFMYEVALLAASGLGTSPA
jgi:hypothetical protein